MFALRASLLLASLCCFFGCGSEEEEAYVPTELQEPMAADGDVGLDATLEK